MTLEKLKQTLEDRVRIARAMLYKLQNPEFEALYIASTPAEITKLQSIINDSDTTRLSEWIHNHSSRDPGELSVRELRDVARQRNIPNYSRLDKYSLVRNIRETDPSQNH